MATVDLSLIDRVIEEPFEDYDIVSALHTQTFNVCCGYAKYNHRKFTDLATYDDIFKRYGNSYGGDEIFMSRFKVKMMWLYYLFNNNVFYQIEGKWLNYATDTTVIIETKERERQIIHGV